MKSLLAVTSATDFTDSHVSFPRTRPVWFIASSRGCVLAKLEGVMGEEVGVGEPGRVGGGDWVTRQNQYWRVEERLSRMCCASG